MFPGRKRRAGSPALARPLPPRPPPRLPTQLPTQPPVPTGPGATPSVPGASVASSITSTWQQSQSRTQSSQFSLDFHSQPIPPSPWSFLSDRNPMSTTMFGHVHTSAPIHITHFYGVPTASASPHMGQWSGPAPWSRPPGPEPSSRPPVTEPSSQDSVPTPARLHPQDTSSTAFSTVDKMTESYRPLRYKQLTAKRELSGGPLPGILRESLEGKVAGLQKAMDQIEVKLVEKLHKKLEREAQGYKFERITPILALHIYDLSTKIDADAKLLTDAQRADLAKARAPGGELHVEDPEPPEPPVPSRPASPQGSPTRSRSPPTSRGRTQKGDPASDSEDPIPAPPLHDSKRTRCQRGYSSQGECWWEDFNKERGNTKRIIETYSSDANDTCITFLPIVMVAWPLHPTLQILSGLRKQRKRWQKPYGCNHCRKYFPFFFALLFTDVDMAKEYADSQKHSLNLRTTFSHTCGNCWCFKLEHIALEPWMINLLRENCFREARRLHKLGRGDEACCNCGADVPCRVQDACMEFDAAIVLEWLNVNAGLTLPLKKDRIAPALVGRGLKQEDFQWLLEIFGHMCLEDCKPTPPLSREQLHFEYYTGRTWHQLELPVPWQDHESTGVLKRHEVESLASYSLAPKMTDLGFVCARIREFISSGMTMEISPWRAFTNVPQCDPQAMMWVDGKRVGWRHVLCHIGFYQSRMIHERDQTNPSRKHYQSMKSILEHLYKKHREVPRSERASFLGTQIDAVDGMWDAFIDMHPDGDPDKPLRVVKDLKQGNFPPEVRAWAGDPQRLQVD